MKKQVLFMSAFLLLCVTGCSNDESEVNDVNNVRGGVIYEGYTQQEIDKSDPLAVFFGNSICYWRLYPKLAQKAIIPKRTVKDVFE